MENNENELKEIEEKEIITEEDIDESDTENKKYDESRIYYVYEHIRLDKMEPFYIGKGKGERAYELYRNDHHDNITDEYGHAVVIIADNLTEEEAYWLERDTIEDYVFNLGYGIDIKGHSDYDHTLPHLTNCTWGGEGHSGSNPYANKTPEEIEIICKKISEKLKGENNPMFGKNKGKDNPMYGKNHTEEAKEKMSENHADVSGEKNPMYGKNPYADKTKEEMEEISKKISEKVSGKNNPMAKKVICITAGKIFYCIKDATIHYKISRQNISDCCKGKRNYAGKLKDGTKLQWKYLEDYNNEFKGILINPIVK